MNANTATKFETWTKEIPTEPGFYWFYGVRFESNRGEPRLLPARVIQVSNGTSTLIDGHFSYQSEFGDFQFIKAITPELPKG